MTDDELLIPKPVAANDGLKAVVLARTARRVRRAAWRRRAAGTVAGLACFAGGWMTTYLRPVPAREVVYVEVQPPPVADAPGLPVPPKEESPAPMLSPAELELAAEQAPEKAEAARRFREAGDRYLREFADYRAALRCYRNFLDEANAADRAVSPADTWLLTSLKRAREQEANP
jgi:hypothetical protein